MLNLTHPLSRWEPVRIDCNSFEIKTDCPNDTNAILERYESSFHMIFNTLKGIHPLLDQISIEGIRLKPLEEFYGLDIVLHINGRCLYLSLEEVWKTFGTVGLPYLR